MNPQLSDKSLKIICRCCPQLEKLDLCHCSKITDKGLALLGVRGVEGYKTVLTTQQEANMPLKMVNIQHLPCVTGESLQHFSEVFR